MQSLLFRFEYLLFLAENMFPVSSDLCGGGILSLQNPSLTHPHNVGILVLRIVTNCFDVPAVQNVRYALNYLGFCSDCSQALSVQS